MPVARSPFVRHASCPRWPPETRDRTLAASLAEASTESARRAAAEELAAAQLATRRATEALQVVQAEFTTALEWRGRFVRERLEAMEWNRFQGAAAWGASGLGMLSAGVLSGGDSSALAMARNLEISQALAQHMTNQRTERNYLLALDQRRRELGFFDPLILGSGVQ